MNPCQLGRAVGDLLVTSTIKNLFIDSDVVLESALADDLHQWIGSLQLVDLDSISVHQTMVQTIAVEAQSQVS